MTNELRREWKKDSAWTKKIKLLKFGTILMIVLSYIVFWNVQSTIEILDKEMKEENKLAMEVDTIKWELDKSKSINYKMENVFDNATWFNLFIDAYNNNYGIYLSNQNSGVNDSLVTMLEVDGVELQKDLEFTDEDIEVMAIAASLYSDNSNKFDFDQRRFLKSLDTFVFTDKLKELVNTISMWKPTLVDHTTGLYRIRFTLITSVQTYSDFVNLLWRFENMISKNSDARLYYNLTQLSKYNLMKENTVQTVNMGWYFYFYRN